MGDMLKGLFGGASPSPASQIPLDDDFADFAGAAPEPVPASISPIASSVASALTGAPTAEIPPYPVPYTKWYRVWERTQLSDFYTELSVLPLLLVIIALYVYGSRANRSRARKWMKTHYSVLSSEFALVGFDKVPQFRSPEPEVATPEVIVDTDTLIKEGSSTEFTTYATGRLNVAFMDLKLTFYQRTNPFILIGQFFLSNIFDSIEAPTERMVATVYPFAGKEKDVVPPPVPGAKQGQEVVESKLKKANVPNSFYEGFVWAVVNKDSMRFLRDERYDISLTATKDHPKLPAWTSVMSENAEITEQLLTPELVKAITECGPENFEYLIISDQPMEKPQKLSELVQHRSLQLSLLHPTNPCNNMLTLFVRIVDSLPSVTRSLRPDAIKKLQQTRQAERRKLEKLYAEEKEEERNQAKEKKKREERERKLRSMTADEQRKFLDKEREREEKKRMGRMTRRA